MLGGKEDPRAAAEGLCILKQSLEVMETVWLQEGYPFLAGCRQPSIADLSLICEIMQLQVRRIACCCYLYILIPCNYTCRTSTSPIFSRKAMRCHVCPVISQVFEQLLCLLEILSIIGFPGISMARLHPHSTQKAICSLNLYWPLIIERGNPFPPSRIEDQRTLKVVSLSIHWWVMKIYDEYGLCSEMSMWHWPKKLLTLIIERIILL